MPSSTHIAPSSSIRLLDRFYGTFLFMCVVFLTIGVPFVFYRKTASAVASLVVAIAVLAMWRMSRKGQPQRSLKIFAAGIWTVLTGLMFAGLPPISTVALAVAVMLAVVNSLRASLFFAAAYFLAWLTYIALQSANLAPDIYFTGAPLTGWFISLIAIWLLLLPITELVHNLHHAASLQTAVIEAATDGILVVNKEGHVETHNQNFADLWNIPQELLNKADDHALLDFVSDQLVDSDQFLSKVQEMYSHPEQSSLDRLIFKDGRILERHSQPQRLDDTVVGRVWSFRDVTENENARAEIYRMAFHDALTTLPNRRLLHERLERALISSARNGLHGALLFIDLDRFKILNDTHGHDKGDMLLQQVGQRLVRCVRDADTVARLGGDEFVVLLESLSQHSKEAAAQAETVGRKMQAALNLPYALGDLESQITPSIGLTLFHGQDASVDELLKEADQAMYQSKAAGRNTLRFFDQAIHTALTERAALEIDLRDAVKQQNFLLYYQPQVVGNGCLTGAEVLVRWIDPKRGIVSPADFIPLSEETGLILPLGRWILETACVQLATWASQPAMANMTLAVNVSANQLRQSDFVEQVMEVLVRTGANPARLKLELTESLLVTHVEETILKMATLKTHGVGFSLDDFGTGYSSLSYLKRLPLEQLKIDQGFVRDILVDPNDAAIAKMVVALAESLGLKVIAEGVELEAQRGFLAEIGCLAYQGYLFSRPLPLAEFEDYCSSTRGDQADGLARC